MNTHQTTQTEATYDYNVLSKDAWIYARLSEITKRSQWINDLADKTHAKIGVILSDWPRFTLDAGNHYHTSIPYPYKMLVERLLDAKGYGIEVYPTVIVNISDSRSHFWDQGYSLAYVGQCAWKYSFEKQMCLNTVEWQDHMIEVIKEIQHLGFHGINITYRNNLRMCACRSTRHTHLNDSQVSEMEALCLFLSRLKTMIASDSFRVFCTKSTAPSITSTDGQEGFIGHFDETIHHYFIDDWLTVDASCRSLGRFSHALPFVALRNSTQLLEAVSFQFVNGHPLGPIPSSYWRLLENIILRPTGRLGKLLFLRDQLRIRKEVHNISAYLWGRLRKKTSSSEGRFLRRLLILNGNLKTMVLNDRTIDQDKQSYSLARRNSNDLFLRITNLSFVTILAYVNPYTISRSIHLPNVMKLLCLPPMNYLIDNCRMTDNNSILSSRLENGAKTVRVSGRDMGYLLITKRQMTEND